MKLQKKHLLWIMGVILILSLVLVTSCSPQQAETEEAVVEEVEEAKVEKADEPLRLVFVSPLIGHPAWLEAKRGSEAAAADYGFEIEWVGPSTIDMDAEIQLIESALATGADGILNCPLNPEAFTAVYQKAMDAGVPIVNVQVDTPEDSRLAFIGTGMVGYGQKAAEELAEKTGGKATIAVMQTSLDSGNQNAEFDAFKAVLDEKYPDMEIVVRETDNSDMVEAIDKINQILLAYPEVDAFLMLEGSAAPAAAQIFMEKKIDDIVVLGIDDLPETLQAIRDGYIWGTLTQNYYVMGYQGTEFILDHIAGKEVPSITDSGTTLVTSDNIDTYNK